MTLGQKIRELRAQRDWTQQELAKRSGLARGYIAHLEIGTIDNPAVNVFLKLAKALNVRLEELYQAAGYIKEAEIVYSLRETPEEILNRLKLDMPFAVPIYEELPLHAGEPVEPVDYASIRRDRARGRTLEGYISSGNCLEPDIKEGDIIIIDRGGQVNNGDIVACLVDDQLHLARLKKIADEIWLENNHGSRKLEECKMTAPVIEVRRRLK